MHSIKSYLERRSDEELKGILIAYCGGYADIDAEAALLICDILFSRTPGQIDPREEFSRLCMRYTQ